MFGHLSFDFWRFSEFGNFGMISSEEDMPYGLFWLELIDLEENVGQISWRSDQKLQGCPEDSFVPTRLFVPNPRQQK